MIPNCTLTTACFDLSKYNDFARPIYISIENMKPLLITPCYLVIFTDTKCIDYIKEIRNSYLLDDLTYYIIEDFENIEFFKYNQLIKKNRKKYHPTKDDRTCSESHLLCCNKFNFVLKTIELNPFQTDKFGWIDSNIQKNFSKISENYTNNMLLHILNNISEKFHIQILNVTDKKYMDSLYKKEYYEEYRWVVAGSFFTTGATIGKKILTRLNENFVKTTHLGYGHGEEMLYLEILDEYYDDIEKSYGDYKNIFNNFLKPVTNFTYIHDYIILKYLDFGYYREAYDCCKKILNEYENFTIEIDYTIYIYLLFSIYVCCFYYNHEELEKIVNKINKLICCNFDFNKEYLKNKDYYDEQLNIYNDIIKLHVE
jgi:hypothetical protein